MFILGCGQITGKAVDVPYETARSPEVYFCPQTDCSKIFESNIKSANLSVYCALYDLKLRNVISALSRKSKTAEVKIVTDESTYKEQIKGRAVRLDDDRQLMHNKFCVIDQNIVVTGSFNPTDNDNNYNNNNVVVVYSGALAKNYEDEFVELWDGRFGEGSNVKYPALYINNMEVENYFCPEDKCASRIISLIEDAKESVYFMAFSFTNGDIADALISRSDLDIKGIFDSSQSSGRYSQFKRLQGFGMNVKKDPNKYKMHHKVFIVDRKIVVTGSFNPTSSADTKNDENLLIIHDENIADVFLEEFGSLWEQ
ncbi:hypothetical protein HYV80_05700 [Candidatus Woesearchaeota archaeon]|nr:hypothetical protein [Candidatus Woesearchaeota archaeon]